MLAASDLGWHLLILPFVIVVAAAVGAGLGGTAGTASHTAVAAETGLVRASAGLPARTWKLTAACPHERGPFHVSGVVVSGFTGRYIPYGISLTGLAHTDYAARVAPDEADISAAADYWCANTVRLQVRQANLVSTTGHVDQAFLAAVATEVRFAEARGLVVVLNLQLPGAS